MTQILMSITKIFWSTFFLKTCFHRQTKIMEMNYHILSYLSLRASILQCFTCHILNISLSHIFLLASPGHEGSSYLLLELLLLNCDSFEGAFGKVLVCPRRSCREVLTLCLVFQCAATIVILCIGETHNLINYVSFINYLSYGVTIAGLLYYRWKKPNLYRPIKVPTGWTTRVLALFTQCTIYSTDLVTS